MSKDLTEWWDELSEYESLDDLKRRMSLIKSRRSTNNIITIDANISNSNTDKRL